MLSHHARKVMAELGTGCGAWEWLYWSDGNEDQRWRRNCTRSSDDAPEGLATPVPAEQLIRSKAIGSLAQRKTVAKRIGIRLMPPQSP